MYFAMYWIMFYVFVLPHLEFLPFVVGGLVFYIKLLCKTLLASFKLFVCEREFTFWSVYTCALMV